MKKTFLLFIVCMSYVITGCNIEQKKDAKLPDVDVDVDIGEGQLPRYDVDWLDIDVGTTVRKVSVPKVVVVMEEVEVDMPFIDFKMPNNRETQLEERTVAVEAEVFDNTHNLEIEEIYVNGTKLYVLSKLRSNGANSKGKKIRLSDRVAVNAPEDLEVRHYIIGKRPAGSFNQQFTYITDKGKIANKLKGGKKIYTRK